MEKIYNFRDFGGLETDDGMRIKSGLLFRSARLFQAADQDLDTIVSLGIRTVIDLRTDKERIKYPDRLPAHSKINSIHLPVKVSQHNESRNLSYLFSLIFGKARRLDYSRISIAAYREYVSHFSPVWAQILKIISNPDNLPVLIHCTAGKDRTGFACSVIQTALGVHWNNVKNNYLQTNEVLHDFKQEMLKRLKFFRLFGVSLENFLPLLEAREIYLQASYDQIQTLHGNFDHYIKNALGMSENDLDAIKSFLLTSSSSPDMTQSA